MATTILNAAYQRQGFSSVAEVYMEKKGEGGIALKATWNPSSKHFGVAYRGYGRCRVPQRR